MEKLQVDQQRLKIAYHETGHAVMALLCSQKIQKISLNEIDSPIGEGKYLAFMKLDPSDSATKLTGEKAIQKIMISLGGYASEIIFYDGVTGIGGDDLSVAVVTAESMLQIPEFVNWVNGLSMSGPSLLDSMIKNPSIRAYIDLKIGETVKVLFPFKPVIQAIAEELLRREELTGDEVVTIFSRLVGPNFCER